MSASNSSFHRLVWIDSLLDRDEVEASSKSKYTFRLEHVPALISDRSIEDAHAQVWKHAAAKLQDGHIPLAETIPMPRNVAGDRPILYTDITTRVAYNAIVAMIEPSLEPSSRLPAARKKFAEFGTDPEPGEYVVISDVAACYEYVVPGLLADEVLLRTDDHAVSHALRQLLAALAVRDRGVPQMMIASDRLVDLYLAIADRTLDRVGLPFARTADDYKIVTEGWVEANVALEALERAMRDLGLTLSTAKTKIVSSGHRATTTPSGAAEPDEEHTEDSDEVPADPADEYLAWHHGWKQERGKVGARKLPPPPPSSNLDLFDDLGSLNPTLLADLVFASPPQLEPVLLLLTRIASGELPDMRTIDEVLDKLCGSHRGNAWSALWLLTTTETLWKSGLSKTSGGSKALIKLARSALKDPRETVRAEAGWMLAQASHLSIDDLRTLYVDASPLTEPGIAATAAYVKATKMRADASRYQPLQASIIAGRPLNQAAAQWGTAAGAVSVAAASADGASGITSNDAVGNSALADSGGSANVDT